MAHAILITGAGTRVGKVLAKGLAKDGHSIAVHYNRSKVGAEALVNEITQSGGHAAAIGANLFVPQDVNTLVKRSTEALGTPITGLINNASTFAYDTALDMSGASYDYHMDVNLKAPLLLSQGLADLLPKESTGFIINMIDQRVKKPNPTFFSYTVSKAALDWATKTLAQSLAPNIRVNAIGPGPSLASIHQDEAVFQAEEKATLLQRGSPPETLLQAARYLVNAEAVTGQLIAVDGGQHLTWQTPDIAVQTKG